MKRETKNVLRLARKQILQSKEISALGVSRQELANLVASGDLVRTARGLYISPDHELTENHTRALVAKRHPQAVLCLLTALSFHELTTEMPHEVWIALPKGSRIPRQKGLRVLRFSEPAYSTGIEVHRIEGVDVKVYSPAKTVADCFKFRSQVTNPVACEALKDAWHQRKATPDELWRCAKACRVLNLMRPCFDMLVAGH